jgi:hypothetical protein
MRTYRKTQDFKNRLKLGAIVLAVGVLAVIFTGSRSLNEDLFKVSGDTVHLPPGTLEVSSTIDVSTKKVYIGHGTTLINKTDSAIFYVTANGAEFIGINFKNENEGKLRSGIYFIGAGLWRVSNCNFTGMDAYGIRYSKTNSHEAPGGSISNCNFSGNKVGVFSDYLGDFVITSSSNFTKNGTAILLRGGNNIVNACNVNYNRFGIEIMQGSNNAHGIISNSNLNHNEVYALKFNDYNSGQSVANCHIFDGDIHIENAYSTKFTGCFIDARNYTMINSYNTEFINCTFTNSYHLKTSGDYKLISCTDIKGFEITKLN